jgi:hypothetical protein
MNAARRLAGAVSALALLLSPLARAAPEVLKEMPGPGELPYNRIVYVDDGKCPRGEVKEVTGGSQSKAIERKVRCVKRPQ